MQPKIATYLDVNAGAHVHPEVSLALRELLQDQEVLGSNPSSVHAHGRKAKKYLSEARDRVALSLGANSNDLIFTSSGTEANQLAIRSVLDASLNQKVGPTFWVTTAVEHECNLKMQDWFRERGGQVILLPVDSNGAPVISKLPELIRPGTALVTSIWVNNETGVVTDVKGLARICQEHKIPLHLDGAQAWGKLPFSLNELSALGVTYAAFAAHKIGALSGTGLLYVSPGASLIAQMRGKQERGRRGGTENVLGIVAAGVAASRIDPERWFDQWGVIAFYRDRLQALIEKKISGTLVNGGRATRAASTLSLCFEGVESDGLVAALDLEGFSVSSGSACSSGVVEPSHVLLALGRTPGNAAAGLRVSIPLGTRWEELERFAVALEKVVARFRKNASSDFPGKPFSVEPLSGTSSRAHSTPSID